MFYPSLPNKHMSALAENPFRQKKNQWGVGAGIRNWQVGLILIS